MDLVRIPVAVICSLACLAGSAQGSAPRTIRISLSRGNSEVRGDSFVPSISADGRMVAFVSTAPDLVPDDTNGLPDIFVRNLESSSTARIAVSTTGLQGDGPSDSPAIASGGQYVAFASSSSNLTKADSNGTSDVFVHDLATGTTDVISVSLATGRTGNSFSSLPSISADGRFVAFVSFASDLVPDDTNSAWDTFVYDRVAGNTELISLSSTGVSQGSVEFQRPAISADGRFVAFSSSASTLVPRDTNGSVDVFVRDRLIGRTIRASIGDLGQANGESLNPSMSRDGRFVVFQSYASNLVVGDINRTFDIFVRDIVEAAITRVSGRPFDIAVEASTLPAISPDGTYIAFQSEVQTLVPDDTNGSMDVFVYDRNTQQTWRASISDGGDEGNNESGAPSLSSESSSIAFVSVATNLIFGDSNSSADVFVRERGQCDSSGEEVGPLSRRIHEAEASARRMGNTVHKLNCTVLASNGL